jgi:hypothetical protein
MSKKYPKSALPENVAKPHVAALRHQNELERVNKILKDEAILLELGTKKSLPRLEQVKNDSKAFTYWAELEFQEYIRRSLEKCSTSAIAILINGGARLLKLSPITTKRYMGKLCLDNGPFVAQGDTIAINPDYVSPEEDSYWLEVQA